MYFRVAHLCVGFLTQELVFCFFVFLNCIHSCCFGYIFYLFNFILFVIFFLLVYLFPHNSHNIVAILMVFVDCINHHSFLYACHFCQGMEGGWWVMKAVVSSHQPSLSVQQLIMIFMMSVITVPASWTAFSPEICHSCNHSFGHRHYSPYFRLTDLHRIYWQWKGCVFIKWIFFFFYFFPACTPPHSSL